MKILILVASMSGTAEFVAEEVAVELERQGIAAQVAIMRDVSLLQLMETKFVLVCASSYGVGEIPDNGKLFYALLGREKPDLTHLSFGVIALGDSAYTTSFCGGPERITERLVSLGAEVIGTQLRHDARSGRLPEEEALIWLDVWLAELKLSQENI